MDMGTRCRQYFGFAAGAVPSLNLMACGKQAARHGHAHQAAAQHGNAQGWVDRRGQRLSPVMVGRVSMQACVPAVCCHLR